jgi:uncharacterized protein Veg
MKQYLLWFFALFFSICTLAQKQTIFEKESLKNILPEIEKFYKVSFSYADIIISKKKSVNYT